MAVEAKRGCGYRKIGGTYLVSDRGGVICDRLPIPLDVCPTCGHGIHASRGWTWVDVAALVGGVHQACEDDFPCPLCMATSDMGRAGLIWIGGKFYATPGEFNREAALLGISRRIAAIPRNFKIGETWVLLAHAKTIQTLEESDGDDLLKQREVWKPGIFKVWRPQRIEKILPESERGSETSADLIRRGITPVFVPDDDPDHAPAKRADEEDE
jgi:hypothetical protein